MKSKKIIVCIIILSLAGINGCYSGRRIINRSINTAETLANEGIDAYGNDIRARLNGKLIDVSLNKPFQLAYDQTAVIKNTDLRIKFSSVTEESRCSRDIQCLRKGQVTILIMASRNRAYYGNYTLTFNTDYPDLANKKIDNYNLTLNSIEPSGFTSYNRPLNSDYSLNLIIRE